MAKTTGTDQQTPSIEEQLSAKLQEVKIIRYRSNDIEYDIEKYKDAKSKGKIPEDMDLNDYIKQTKYPNDPNAVVVTDMRNQRFETDLSGVDFSGCMMSGAQFYSCDLTNAKFRDADLREVIFDDSILKNADFRGADLTNCRFADSYQK